MVRSVWEVDDVVVAIVFSEVVNVGLERMETGWERKRGKNIRCIW